MNSSFTFNDREHIEGTKYCPRCDEIIQRAGSASPCECGGFIHHEEKKIPKDDLVFWCDKCGDSFNEVWGN